MKAGKIEERYICIITREVLQALSYLHKCKIIHRDIKGRSINNFFSLCAPFNLLGDDSHNPCLLFNSREHSIDGRGKSATV